MIKCHKCNEPANSFNDSPEMRKWIFWWCIECDIIVIPSAAEAEAEVARLANQPYQLRLRMEI
jgi:hypothetical protein